MKSSIALFLASASLVYSQTSNVTEPSLSDIRAAAVSTKPSSPVSNVPGLSFDRFFQVWLENIVRFKSIALNSLVVLVPSLSN